MIFPGLEAPPRASCGRAPGQECDCASLSCPDFLPPCRNQTQPNQVQANQIFALLAPCRFARRSLPGLTVLFGKQRSMTSPEPRQSRSTKLSMQTEQPLSVHSSKQPQDEVSLFASKEPLLCVPLCPLWLKGFGVAFGVASAVTCNLFVKFLRILCSSVLKVLLFLLALNSRSFARIRGEKDFICMHQRKSAAKLF